VKKQTKTGALTKALKGLGEKQHNRKKRLKNKHPKEAKQRGDMYASLPELKCEGNRAVRPKKRVTGSSRCWKKKQRRIV